MTTAERPQPPLPEPPKSLEVRRDHAGTELVLPLPPGLEARFQQAAMGGAALAAPLLHFATGIPWEAALLLCAVLGVLCGLGATWLLHQLPLPRLRVTTRRVERIALLGSWVKPLTGAAGWRVRTDGKGLWLVHGRQRVAVGRWLEDQERAWVRAVLQRAEAGAHALDEGATDDVPDALKELQSSRPQPRRRTPDW